MIPNYCIHWATRAEIIFTYKGLEIEKLQNDIYLSDFKRIYLYTPMSFLRRLNSLLSLHVSLLIATLYTQSEDSHVAYTSAILQKEFYKFSFFPPSL